MAKISLRSYNHEIEGMIERGQLDEAIAHCRHILQTFPKHLETYRLLGKTYLEAKRYNEAVDIFQRVLVSAPDDFVSHVGMSIIADEQGKLDEAIWHMERAFEVQPSNAAIQGELQRLFGRRDGVQPPKIRLTRGALAHMYVQGELYMQAISEIQAVLGSDAGRTDMKILLGKAYFRNGQKPEANDICNQLLKQFPYCLDANRIMVEILPASQAAESTQVYRHRVSELDPYATFVQDSIFHSDEVPDASVSLERLEYTGQPVDLGANWGGTLGIGLASDATAVASAADQPDWLKAASATPSAPTPLTAAPAPQSSDQIPDFMRQAGWTESSGEEAPSEAAEPEAIQADLPDWVKAMAPSDQSTPAPAPEPSAPASDVPDWLKGLGEQEPPTSAPASASAPQDESDWLRNLGGSQPLEEQTPAADLPDWLKNLDQPSPASTTSTPAPVTPEVSKPVTVPPPPVQAPAPAPVSQVESTPVPAAPPSTIGDLGTSAQEQDDAMAWLESLAAKHGAKPEELVTDPNARTDVAPEWVDKAKQIGEQAPAPASTDETGMWLKNLEASEAETPAAKKETQQPVEENISDWRAGLTGQDNFAVEESGKEEQPIAGAESAPDWSSGLGAAPAQNPEETHSEDVPEWLRPAAEKAPEPTFDASQDFSFDSTSAANLPDWLAGLDKEEQQTLTPPSTSDEELPSWLQGEAEPQTAEPTQPADWQPIEAKPVASPPVSEPEPVVEKSESVAAPKPKPERKAPARVARPKQEVSSTKVAEASLTNAQAELGRGNIAASLEIYGKLIRKAKSLEEIIRDLREALYRYPVEVPIWQALGDAYMRANRLQEALDAYTKAEELLR